MTEVPSRAALLGKRVGLGIVIVVTLAFIADSALQIVPAVFGARIEPIPDAPRGSPEFLCAAGIRSLAADVDRGTPWNEGAEYVGDACSRARGGQDAWASLMRLREARRSLPDGGSADLEPLRRDVDAHLPPQMR